MNKLTLEIANKFSKKYNIKEEIVIKILDMQGVAIRKAIENKKEINLIGFGSFKIKPGRIEALKYAEELRKQGVEGSELRKMISNHIKNIKDNIGVTKTISVDL